MKTIIKIAFFLLGVTSSFSIWANCAEINFYRTNGIQSDKIVYLYYEGAEIAAFPLGQRYTATVCQDGNYTFTAKADRSAPMSLAKTTVNVMQGNTYFVKISCAVGLDYANVTTPDFAKARSDWSKDRKFKGAPQTLYINGQVAGNPPPQPPQTSNNFERTQIRNNIKFEIIDVIKAGNTMQFDMMITNMNSNDKKLWWNGHSIYFYDENGKTYTASNVCVMGECGSYPANQMNEYVLKGQFYNANSIKSVLPYGIPVKANFKIREISNSATKFLRGAMIYQMAELDERSYQDMVFPLNNIIFGDEKDANNPMKRNVGKTSVELLKVDASNDETVFTFRHDNKDIAMQNLQVKSAHFYDNLGNKQELKKVAFINQAKADNYYRYYRNWKTDINPNSSINTFLIFDKVANGINNIVRIVVDYGVFNLDWENISVSVNGTSSTTRETGNPSIPAMGYITYTDFESKARNKENISGKKVILENIYFDTGSDAIKATSYTQLDQLSNTLLNNTQLKVEISGHTDNVGNPTSNMLLSQKRADNIRYYLIGKQITPDRISSVGKGEKEPLRTNTSTQNKKENRRVEIKVVQ